MDYTKNILSKSILAVISVLTLLVGAESSAIDWVTYTSFKEVRRIQLINDTVYLATSGGLLALADFNLPGTEYTNVNGLGTTDITDVTVDDDGQKWVSGAGRLVKFNGTNSVQFLFLNTEGETFKLHCLEDDGNFLWIGTELGLVLFSKLIDGGQIQDSYGLFGDLNPQPDVFDIYLDGDTIWIATSSGLAVSDKSIPSYLKSPANWTVFSVINYPELGTETIRNIISFENELYIGTAKGLFRLDRSPSDTAFVPMSFGRYGDITDLIIENDTLFIYADSGLALMKDGLITPVTLTGLTSPPVTGLRAGAYHWVGAGNNGVFRTTAGGIGPGAYSFEEYVYTGMPGNNVSDVTVNRYGRISAVFTTRPAADYIDGVWVSRPYNVKDRTMDIISDSSGNTWTGTFGIGLYQIVDDLVYHYDTTNSSLRGVAEGRGYIVVYDLDTDGRYIYAACYRSHNGYPVAVGDLDNLDDPSGWDSLIINDVITDARIFTLDYYDGYLAVGSELDGVFLCHVGSDPFDDTETECEQFTESNSFLLSNLVRNVKFSPVTGELWAATNFGLSRYDSGYERFLDVYLPVDFGPEVMTIEFDSRGNLWAGGKNGVARFGEGELRYYTTLNSDLVSNDIRNITYDIYTGDVYIATAAGISKVPSDIGLPATEVEQVLAFPNPFVIETNDDVLKFNFAGVGKVTIYNAAGETIKELIIDPAFDSYWNGLNQNGEPVASGVYLFVITDDEGNVGRGKFVLIRNR